MDHVQHKHTHDVASVTAWIGRYLSLTKPGIVIGNTIATAGGFMLGTPSGVSLTKLLLTVLGVGWVVAGACVFNNIIDRDIDRLMYRTRRRPLATQAISWQRALCFGLTLTLAGGWLLQTIQPKALMIALLGFVFYVGVYSLWLKRQSLWSTWIGSLAGAAPALAGYGAAGATLWAPPGWGLLGVFCLWQIPHADAIALLHWNDFKTAGVCVLPVSHGAQATCQRLRWSTPLFAVTSSLLVMLNRPDRPFALLMTLVNAYWVYQVWMPHHRSERIWARHLLHCSLMAMMLLSLTLMAHQ